MLNKAMIIGHVGHDPKVSDTTNGNKMAKFSLAVKETYKGNESVEWFNVTFWGRTAEVIEQYVHKGSKLFVEGKFKSHEYVDKEGINRKSFEINGSAMQMLGGGKAIDNEGVRPENPNSEPFDDDIPF